MKEQKIWFRLGVKDKKHWWGYSYKDTFIEVKILGKCAHVVTNNDGYLTYLIELPTKEKIECLESDLIFERGEIQV